ncbi:MAG: 50S ribosomal protein L11 methyltransferase [Syntrophales bacterium]|jgi:ribosomal protein L11 methyltransferase|nr:50S ribosomal protein L11 methyltransferase [Syntrophales bacterium]MDY0044875.1 50S ribosomal protein L11 methyltransferase [Syntrophales bacterium]
MPAAKESWIEITVKTPSELSDAIANFLEELGTKGVFQEETEEDSFNNLPIPREVEELKAYLPYSPESGTRLKELGNYISSLSELFPEKSIPTFSTSTIIDPDWAERWKKYFKPLRVSKNIIVKPTWERYIPEGRDIVIEIDPGMAFGTGQHASTRLCINALEEIILRDRPHERWDVLDVGTGTGILAICCIKLGVEHVMAIDLDNQAIEIAGKNIEINHVADKIDIVNRDASMVRGSFNLIVANLTAPTLINLQEQLVSMMKPGGYLVASGITDMYINQIEKVFKSDSISIYERLAEKEWVCIVFRKKESPQ